MAPQTRSILAALITSGVLAATAFYLLTFVPAYTYFLVPLSLVGDVWPGWYIFGVSLVGCTFVGAGIGLVYAWLMRGRALVWTAGFVALVSAAHLGIHSSLEAAWTGPVWWVPLVDVGFFVVAAFGTSAMAARWIYRAEAI